MITIKTEKILSRLRDLKPQVFTKFRVKDFHLFGSIARREQKPGSDIDILVDFEDDADLFDLTGMADFLEEELKQKVDIVPKGSLRKKIRDSISEEIIKL